MLSVKQKFVLYAALLLVIMIIETLRVFALDPQKTITQYGHNVWFRQNGLPANAVYASLQTLDGYLWLGTSAGLFRFDGVNFYEVKTNVDKKINETISTLCMSRDSSLWIGTSYAGLRRLKDGKIIVYGPADGFYETQVRALYESHDGNLWIGTSNGLFKFSNKVFVSVPFTPNFITGITEDSHHRIWVGTHAGVRIFESSSAAQVDSITTVNGLPHNITTCIYADRRENLWIGTANGLARWKNGTIKVYTGTDGLSNNHITNICEDKDNNLWLGTYKGISRLSGNKWAVMTTSEGLSNNNILSIMEDYEGSLWIGTLEGWNRLMDVNITSYTTREGLANDYVTSVVETRDGNIYFLSEADISITRLKNGRFTKFPTDVGPAYAARDGSMWISQSGMLIHVEDGRITRNDSRNGLPAKWISAITEDDRSLVVYVDDIGIRRFINGKLEPYLLKDGTQYSSTEYVTCFHSEQGGPLWIGTSHGLVKIENGESVTFTPANGLAGDWVSSIFDDRKGNLWIGSQRDGLTRYSNGKFKAITVKDGLFTNEIYCVLCDESGDLWMSSPRGIGHVARQSIDDYESGKIKLLYTNVYVTADGMKTDECFGEWQPAGIKSHDGRIWFATKRGAVMIDPKNFKHNELPPPVLVESFVANQQALPLNRTVSLAPGTNKLEFHYTALSYLVPDRVIFKYKLEGYDQDWVDAGTRRVAYYTNLPPRDYEFRVIACNNDGLWNKTGASLVFKLEPHFYETYWFYGILLIAFGAGIFGLVRLRVWQLVKRDKELQARIREALANIKALSGLLPICANCKKIRDDRGYWDQLEEYIQNHSEVTFSHGICPDCAEKLYPGLISPNKKP
jgi:ligand-binding sensor domain-containing protein